MIANPSTPKVAPGNVADSLYRNFVEHVREYAMLFLDRQGNVSSWNDGAELIKGWTPEEIVGKHFSLFYLPTDVANKKPQYELQVATMDGRFEDESWRLRKDGRMFWANVVITAVKDVDGTLLGFAKITRDMTERRNAEQALRESEAQHRLVLSSIQDHAIIMLDQRGRIVAWNDGAKRVHGHEAEDVVGRSFDLLHTEEDRARGAPAEALAAAERDGSFTAEAWRTRKDGSRFRATVTITPLRGSDGAVRGYAKITRDLTHHRAPS